MLLATLVLIAQASAAPVPQGATPYSGRAGRVHVVVPRLDQDVRIDGVMDEPPWQNAARLVDFSTYAPQDGAASLEQTEVLIFYSGEAIYFGVRAQAPRGTVRATLANRDQLATEDQIRIFLSTFADVRQAFYFSVNPLGVQADGVLVEGTAARGGGSYQGLATGRDEPDLAPDFVFESKGRITEEGYAIEMRIPFKSLRFQAGDRQSWGIHITRVQQWNGREDSWAPARRAASSFLAQGGTLDGLADLNRGVVLDLTPEVTGRIDGAPGTDAWSYDTRRPSAGATIRWGMTPTLTLNGTINPDFSQTEADASQLQYDPRTAIFYPEKRPFFLDGLEQFSTPNQLIYTRRIVDPLGAAKFVGRIGGTSVAILSALDNAGQSVTGDTHPRFNLTRIQRDLFGQSRIGLVVTDRRDGPDANLVVASDARLTWRGVWSLSGQAGASRTVSDGHVTNAPVLQAGLERNGRHYGLTLLGRSLGEHFRADSGFIARPGVTSVMLDQRWTVVGKEHARFASFSTDVVTSLLWRTADLLEDGRPLERKLNFNNNAVLRGGWRAGGTVALQRFDFDPVLYREYRLLGPDGAALPFTGTPYIHNLNWLLSLATPRFSRFSASVLRLWGRDENFFEWSPANFEYLDQVADYRPTARVRLEQRYQLQYFQRRSDRTPVGVRHIHHLKLEYQLTRATFLRGIGEYTLDRQDDLRDDGRTGLPILIRDAATGSYARAVGAESKRLRLDWLFSYQPVPGTVFFAGYGSLLGLEAPPRGALRRERDGWFMKLSYLFRM